MSSEIKVEVKDYYHQTDPQYKLRWPVELRKKVSQSAAEHNRSMNADIVARLEESFNPKQSIHPDDIEALVDERVIGLLEGIILSFQFVLNQNKSIGEDDPTRYAFEIAMFELGAIKFYIKNKYDLNELHINTLPKAIKALEKVTDHHSVDEIRADLYADIFNDQKVKK